MLDIICPLVEIELTDLPQSEDALPPPPPALLAPTALILGKIWKMATSFSGGVIELRTVKDMGEGGIK